MSVYLQLQFFLFQAVDKVRRQFRPFFVIIHQTYTGQNAHIVLKNNANTRKRWRDIENEQSCIHDTNMRKIESDSIPHSPTLYHPRNLFFLHNKYTKVKNMFKTSPSIYY